MTTLLIFGGRNFNDYTQAYTQLNLLHKYLNITKVIEGGARGADTIGRTWAKTKNITTHTEQANWNRQPDGSYDKLAGFKRNLRMAEMLPDCAFMMPGGNGTAHMEKTLQKWDIPIISIYDNIPSYFLTNIG